MTIWVATLPITSSEDTFDSPVSATPFTPPYGFKLLKRNRGVTMVVDDISIALNLYKLGFKDPADDIFWVGDPATDEPGMTDENQTEINRVLCELFRKVELDMRTNLMAFWYLPKGKTPDTADGKLLQPIFDLRIINFIRARWLTRQGPRMSINPGDITKINLNTLADFTWSFSFLFLLETQHGNFIWSNPEYEGGDNTIRPYEGDPKDFTEPGFSGRCKGKHLIGKYCGDQVKFMIGPANGS